MGLAFCPAFLLNDFMQTKKTISTKKQDPKKPALDKKLPAKLPALLQAIALAVLGSGCSGAEEPKIDRSRFKQDVCTSGTWLPLQRIQPAAGIDSVQLRSNLGDPSGMPTIIDTFGVPCAAASDQAACKAAIEALHDPQKGWSTGGFSPELHYLVTTSGDMVQAHTTVEQARAVLGTIDTPEEAAFVISLQAGNSFSCGGNAHALADGSFEILVNTGSGCGEGDDRKLNVVVVHPDGSTEVSETELIEKGDPNCVIGRLTEGLGDTPRGDGSLGAFFARMAYLEAAAVPAFERLARELEAHGAPGRLVSAAKRAARDETRHARSIRALSRRFGEEPAELVVDELPVRGLEQMALENAAEGCVRETFGALVATVQARAARDPQIAKLMKGIARDETRHAQLSWEVELWARGRLDEGGRSRLDGARADALCRLRGDIANEACSEAIELAGFPEPSLALSLLDRLAPELSAA